MNGRANACSWALRQVALLALIAAIGLTFSHHVHADTGPCDGIKQSLILLSANARMLAERRRVMPTEDDLAASAVDIALSADPWGRKWRIEGPLEGPRVYTGGEDGIAGTSDDVRLEHPERTCPYDGFLQLQVGGSERLVPFRSGRFGIGAPSQWTSWPMILAIGLALSAVGFALLSEAR